LYQKYDCAVVFLRFGAIWNASGGKCDKKPPHDRNSNATPLMQKLLKWLKQARRPVSYLIKARFSLVDIPLRFDTPTVHGWTLLSLGLDTFTANPNLVFPFLEKEIKGTSESEWLLF